MMAPNDNGPSVRPMSAGARAQARDTLLAEVNDAGLAKSVDESSADVATFGRDGLDDASPPRKRWFALGAGLAVAAAGAAIIAGTGLGFGEDLGADPAGPTDTQDNSTADTTDRAESDGVSKLTHVKGECLGLGDSGDDQTAVVYEHQTAAYAIVAVTVDGSTDVCATNGQGMHSSETSGGVDSSGLSQIIRQTSLEGDMFTELLGGRVAADVTAVEVRSDDTPVAEAHIDDGWFSAVATTAPDAQLSYHVTLDDGTDTTVAAKDSLYPDPLEQQERTKELEAEIFSECSGNPDGITAYIGQSYVFVVAVDGDEFKACTSTYGETLWEASQAEAMTAGAVIVPFEPTPAPTDSGPYPVMGRAAPEVTSVQVVRSDGSTRQTHLEDGFYSVMMSAEKAKDVTYIVTTEDGETTTVG